MAVSLDYGAQVSVQGDDALTGVTWELGANAPAGLAFTDGLLTGTPTAPTAPLTVSRRARNSGGVVTVQCRIEIVASTTAPIINSSTPIGAQVLTEDTGVQGIDVAALTTGSPAITFSLDAPAFTGEIVPDRTRNGLVYAVKTLWGGDTPPTFQWKADGNPLPGYVDASFDVASGVASGLLTCEITCGGFTRETAGVNISGGVSPVFLSSETSGINSAETTFDATHPAYSTGDLVITVVAIDRDVAQITPITLTTTADVATGPDGETLRIAKALSDNTAAGTGGTGANSLIIFDYTALADRASGANLRLSMGQANGDAWTIAVLVFEAGTFNPTTPISDVTTAIGEAETAMASPTTTATNANGVVVFAAAVDFDDTASTPAGWTKRAEFDIGAQAVCVFTRDALTTASEIVASASFPINGTEGWVGSTFVINPR